MSTLNSEQVTVGKLNNNLMQHTLEMTLATIMCYCELIMCNQVSSKGSRSSMTDVEGTLCGVDVTSVSGGGLV